MLHLASAAASRESSWEIPPQQSIRPSVHPASSGAVSGVSSKKAADSRFTSVNGRYSNGFLST